MRSINVNEAAHYVHWMVFFSALSCLVFLMIKKAGYREKGIDLIDEGEINEGFTTQENQKRAV